MDIFIIWMIIVIAEVFLVANLINKNMKCRVKYIVLLVLFEMIISIVIPIITNNIFMNNFEANRASFFPGLGAMLVTVLSITINIGIFIVLHYSKMKTFNYKVMVFILLIAMSISLQVYLSFLAES